MTTYVVDTNTVQSATYATVGLSDKFFSFAGTTLLITDNVALAAAEGGRFTINGSVLGGDDYVIREVAGGGASVAISVGWQGSVEGGDIAILGGQDWAIENAGLISGRSAIALVGDGSVLNTGEIRGSINPSSPTVVLTIDGVGTLINHGLITGFLGARLGGSGDSAVVNTGTITSVAGFALAYGNGAASNSGFIHSVDGVGVAMYLDYGRLENSGTISGGLAAVFGDAGDESILNTGTLSGDVLLMAGNDFLDGRLGIQAGLVDAGEGDDVLLLGSADEIAYGDLGRDTIHGGAGDDVIDGGLGADFLDGGAGRDLLEYCGCGGPVHVSLADGAGHRGGARGDTVQGFEDVGGTMYADTIEGDEGDNLLAGRSGADRLLGGEGHDTLLGGAHGDRLTGGSGGDVLRGQGGPDVFVYAELTDSAPRAADRDRIFGFTAPTGSGVHDLIDLSALDAIAATEEDDAFTFVGDAAFSGAGQLRAVRLANGHTLVEAEVTGDGKADFAILLIRFAPVLAEDAFNL